MNEKHNDHLPTATLATLKERATMVTDIRRFFESKGFFHVETPILSNDIVVDRHLYPIPVDRSKVIPGHSHPSPLWLQTSPEFGMKRLLTAGATAIYQIGKVFRASETGTRHNPEFTMLEWYRVGDGMSEGIDLLVELVEHILQRTGTQRFSYQDLFLERVGLNPHTATVSEFQRCLHANEVDTSSFPLESTPRDEWLNLVLTELIEQELGHDMPVVVYDWPASQSALARVRDEQPPVAERFEIYVDGLELANGYHELLDAQELLKRNQSVNRQRAEDGNPTLPSESRLLESMRQGMPACSGVALGVDRLAMLKLGKTSIEEVIPFPIDRA